MLSLGVMLSTLILARSLRSAWSAAIVKTSISGRLQLPPGFHGLHAEASTSSPTTPTRTGVLCHGYHLEASGWEEVMYGAGKKMGRLAKAAQVAHEEDACVVVFGSGASSIDGVFEGQYGINHLLTKWKDLGQFDAFAEKNLDLLRDQLAPTFVADSFSGNTYKELVSARQLFIDAGCNRVFIVSSPTHLPRCVKEACVIFGDGRTDSNELGDATVTTQQEEEQRQTINRMTVYAVASDTCFPGTHPSDIAIVEPPHLPHHVQALAAAAAAAVVRRRNVSGGKDAGAHGGGDGGDNTTPLLHTLTARALRLPMDKKADFQLAMHALLVEIEKEAEAAAVTGAE